MSREKDKGPTNGTVPDLGAALDGVRELYETTDLHIPGDVVNKRLDPESRPHPDPDYPVYYHYTAFDPTEMNPGRVRKLRDKLRARKYWPATELPGGEEYIPEIYTAEIWMTYQDVARAHFEQRKAANAARNNRREKALARQRDEVRRLIASLSS